MFDVNRYREEDLYRAANLITSVFALDQKMEAGEIIRRLRRLATVLKGFNRDEFRQFAAWLGHVLQARLPEELRGTAARIADETNPWEGETITNLEIALDELAQQALLKGKLETARAALDRKLPDDLVMAITGLDRETIQRLKDGLN